MSDDRRDVVGDIGAGAAVVHGEGHRIAPLARSELYVGIEAVGAISSHLIPAWQYELRERAVMLGWPAHQIVVIDADLVARGADRRADRVQGVGRRCRRPSCT